MFQYAIARVTQIENNSDYIELNNNENFGENQNRLFAYKLTENCRVTKKMSNKKWDFLTIIKRFPSINPIVYMLLRFFGLYVEETNKIIRISKGKRHYYFHGYWQSPKYFDKYRMIIKQDFTIKEDLNNNVLEIMKEIEECNSVCLHIRLGDYITKYAKKHFVCNKKYYEDAIDYMLNNVNNPTFYVFSDEIEKTKEMLKEYKNLNIKYMDQNNAEYIDMAIMSKCKHFIISNSTFSWWGQYLSDNENKIVCAPSEWLNIEGGWPNIYQDNWTIMPIK